MRVDFYCLAAGVFVALLNNQCLALRNDAKQAISQISSAKAGASMLFNKLRQQPSFGLITIIKKGRWDTAAVDETTTIIDLISVLGRIESREDFYPGTGYARPTTGLLTKSRFYEIMKTKDFKQWPRNELNLPLGCDDITQKEFDELCVQLRSSPVSKVGCDALFTSFSKGAANGVAYPQQVDEAMSKWLCTSGSFDLEAFEQSLLLGKVNVAVGWFLFIGLQFVAYYVIFFVPIMQQFFPDFDYYFVRTYLHVHFGLG